MNLSSVFYQATLWVRFVKASPIIILSSSGVLYLSGFRHWDLLIDTLLVFSLITCVFWWFWVVFTIMHIARALERSKLSLQDIMIDVKSVKDGIKDLRN
jgi:hypothetical protein